MAVTPYFVADMDTMKSNLRLTNVVDTEDANTIMVRGVEQARGDIFTRLGVSLAVQWAGVSYVENPTTEQAVLRMLANTLEVDLVLCHLVVSLPNFFMDDSGGTQEAYNDEAAFRKRSSEERREMCAKLNTEIDEIIALLKGDKALGNAARINVTTIEPDEDPPTMGESTMWLPYPFDGNFRSSGLYPSD